MTLLHLDYNLKIYQGTTSLLGPFQPLLPHPKPNLIPIPNSFICSSMSIFFFFLLLLLLSTKVIILAQVFTLAAPSACNVLVAPSQPSNLCSNVSSLESHPMKINPLQSFSNSHSALFPSKYDHQLNLY